MAEKSSLPETWRQIWLRRLCYAVVGLFFLLIFYPRSSEIKNAPENSAVQQAHTIGVGLFAYANDHNLAYPDGKSSTEVFQKLLDDGYVPDPAVFYLPYKGKITAQPRQKLKPENVSFDFTAGGDLHSSEQLPLVFSTGYKISYQLGAEPVALFKIFPDGLAIYYKRNSAMFLHDYISGEASHAPIHYFIPDAFKSEGYSYRQLTPDGVMP